MNLFDISALGAEEEYFQPLIPDHGVLIERIVSSGQSSPPGFWYEQKRDEWVVLLQGKAVLAWEGERRQTLNQGDWILIPAGERHRVELTSFDPPCIWLAVHGRLLEP